MITPIHTWMRVLFFSFLLLSSPSFAEKIPNELVVRFKNSHALMSSDYSALVNPAERIVKMTFKSAEEADAARAKLMRSGNVESVAPNFVYKLAMHYELQNLVEEAKSLTLPFFSFIGHFDTSTDLPEIELPVAANPGADPLASKDWALQAIQMPSAETVASLQARRDSVLTAVIDTGVDYNHEDLKGALWRDSDGQNVGYDFAHNVDKPYDVKHFDIDGCLNDPNCVSGETQGQYLTNPGHGTHCAGHVGAVADNSLGIRGVGGKVQVMALKIFYDYTDGKNAGTADDVASIKAIDYAIDHGVKVISASWGGRMDPSDAESSELKNAFVRAQKAGILVVVAAGNDAIDNDSDSKPDYPANFHLDNMIVVAASDSSDNLAKFSNYGATKVDIAAPGVKILSTTVGSNYDDTVVSFTYHGKAMTLNWDGTSMATPIVAGAAALIWSQHPDEDYSQIKQRIMNSVRTVPALSGKVVSGGVLNVSAALGL